MNAETTANIVNAATTTESTIATIRASKTDPQYKAAAIDAVKGVKPNSAAARNVKANIKPAAKKTVKTATSKYAAAKAVKAAKLVAKKAVKLVAKKAVKPVAKKAVKATATERKTSLFSLTAKVKVEDMGDGQRGAIAKILKKRGAATRAQLIEALPDVPPANISWHLSTMIAAKQAKKAAQ